MLRAAIAAESAGIPSVSIVCEGFDGQARATARGHGYDGLPLAVTVGHVDAQFFDQVLDRAALGHGMRQEQVVTGIGSWWHCHAAYRKSSGLFVGRC